MTKRRKWHHTDAEQMSSGGVDDVGVGGRGGAAGRRTVSVGIVASGRRLEHAVSDLIVIEKLHTCVVMMVVVRK